MANHSWVRSSEPMTIDSVQEVVDAVLKFTKLDVFYKFDHKIRWWSVFERVTPTKRRKTTEEFVLDFWVEAKGPSFKTVEFRFAHYEGDIGAWIMFNLQYALNQKFGGHISDEGLDKPYVPNNPGTLAQYLNKMYKNPVARAMMKVAYRGYLTKTRYGGKTRTANV